jgi:ADP-ribose pyrophosphatase YjhB (NUDIX family)
MPEKDFVNLGLVRNSKGEILMVKRKPEQGLNGAVLIWGLPGGHQYENEPREECVERKVIETTGYKVKCVRQIAMRVHPQFSRVICQFVCDLLDENPVQEPKLQEHDIEEVKWIKPEEFLKYVNLDVDPNVLKEIGVEQIR